MENPETPVRILVVDDEPDIRNILHILLSSRGYEVDEAENGLRAVELVRAQPDYDLIILDIMMPGMDGVSACAEIRQHSVAPILFLTAKAQPADMSDAYGSGGDDYLIKPFSNHELFLRVDSAFRAGGPRCARSAPERPRSRRASRSRPAAATPGRRCPACR